MNSRRMVILRVGQWAALASLAWPLGGAFAQAAAPAAPAASPTAASPSTLRIVVPYPPGGSSDRAARILAEALQPRLGATVIVDNIVGAGGRLALRQLAGQADANVLVLVNPALMVVAPLVYKNNGYDPDKDFQPITQVSTYEFAVVSGSAVPVRELPHLLAWVRANPDKANLGVPATGSLPHFVGLMMGQASKATLQVVGYKGSAPLSTDLIGGHIPMAVDTLDTLLPLHEGGTLRILATSGAQRAVKSIPTFREAGLNVTATGWNVLYAKTGMPDTMVERVGREVVAVMKQADVREKFIAAKAEPVSADRASTVRMLDAFKAQWVPVIRQSGLQFD
jgi:tripartite-type tricarboxylate transporter receptor subunit TctC